MFPKRHHTLHCTGVCKHCGDGVALWQVSAGVKVLVKEKDTDSDAVKEKDDGAVAVVCLQRALESFRAHRMIPLSLLSKERRHAALIKANNEILLALCTQVSPAFIPDVPSSFADLWRDVGSTILIALASSCVTNAISSAQKAKEVKAAQGFDTDSDDVASEHSSQVEYEEDEEDEEEDGRAAPADEPEGVSDVLSGLLDSYCFGEGDWESRVELCCLTPTELLSLRSWKSYFSKGEEKNYAKRRRAPDSVWYIHTVCPKVKKPREDVWQNPNRCTPQCSRVHTAMELQFHPATYKSLPCNATHYEKTGQGEVRDKQLCRLRRFMCPRYHAEFERDAYDAWRQDYGACWEGHSLPHTEIVLEDQEAYVSRWRPLIDTDAAIDQRALRNSKCKRRLQFAANAKICKAVQHLYDHHLVACVETIAWAARTNDLSTLRKRLLCISRHDGEDDESNRLVLHRLTRPGCCYFLPAPSKRGKRRNSGLLTPSFLPVETRTPLLNHLNGLLVKCLQFARKITHIPCILPAVGADDDEAGAASNRMLEAAARLAELFCGEAMERPYAVDEVTGAEDDDADGDVENNAVEEEAAESEVLMDHCRHIIADIEATKETQDGLDVKNRVRSQLELIVEEAFRIKKGEIQFAKCSNLDLEKERATVSIFGSSHQGLAMKDADADLSLGKALLGSTNLNREGVTWGRKSNETKLVSVIGDKFMRHLGAYKTEQGKQRSPWIQENDEKKLSTALVARLKARVPIVAYKPHTLNMKTYNPRNGHSRMVVILASTLLPGNAEQEDAAYAEGSGSDSGSESWGQRDEDGEEAVRKLPSGEEMWKLLEEGLGKEAVDNVIVDENGDYIVTLTTEEDALKALCNMSAKPEFSLLKPLNLSRRPEVALFGVLRESWCLPVMFHNEFDLSLRFTGPRGTQYIRENIEKNPQWHAFLFAVKLWAGETRLIKTDDPPLTSYTVLVLAINFLNRWCRKEGLRFAYQDPNAMEYRSQDETNKLVDHLAEASPETGRAMLAFFRYYSGQFSYKESVVVFPSASITSEAHKKGILLMNDCAKHPYGLYPTKAQWEWSSEGLENTRWMEHMMVSDPMESRTNLTRFVTTTKLKQIRAIFSRSAQHICESWQANSTQVTSPPFWQTERYSVERDTTAPIHSEQRWRHSLGMEIGHHFLHKLQVYRVVDDALVTSNARINRALTELDSADLVEDASEDDSLEATPQLECTAPPAPPACGQSPPAERNAPRAKFEGIITSLQATFTLLSRAQIEDIMMKAKDHHVAFGQFKELSARVAGQTREGVEGSRGLVEGVQGAGSSAAVAGAEEVPIANEAKVVQEAESVKGAAEAGEGEEASAAAESSPSFQADIDLLSAEFPDAPRSEIESVLKDENNGDVRKTRECLLNMYE